jgi:hypothetical protein
MKFMHNSGYCELVLGPGDLEGFVFDEAFLAELERSEGPLVVNLRQFPVMGSERIVRLVRWLAEADTLSAARIVLFSTPFAGKVLSGLLGRVFSVFTEREALELSVRQDVSIAEKDMLWG